MIVLNVSLTALAWLLCGYAGARLAILDLEYRKIRHKDFYGSLWAITLAGPIGALVGLVISLPALYKKATKNSPVINLSARLFGE